MILAAARDIIVREGLGALSTRAIARHIGYTTGTLYQYFEDIDDIVLRVNALTMQGLIDRLEGAEHTLASDPRARIHGYADLYLAYVSENRNAWDAMFSVPRSGRAPVPEWYRAQINRLIRFVTECFASLERGETSASPQAAARMVWASVHSVCTLESGGRLKLILQRNLEPVIHDLVDIHIQAYISTAPPRTRRRVRD